MFHSFYILCTVELNSTFCLLRYGNKKMYAIIGALITGGLGVSLASVAPQAAHAALTTNWGGEKKAMKKLLAIISAIIAGGLGIAPVNSVPQAAHAAFSTN